MIVFPLSKALKEEQHRRELQDPEVLEEDSSSMSESSGE